MKGASDYFTALQQSGFMSFYGRDFVMSLGFGVTISYNKSEAHNTQLLVSFSSGAW